MGSASKAIRVLPILSTVLPTPFAPILGFVSRYGTMIQESNAAKRKEKMRYANDQAELAMNQKIRAADAQFAENERIQTLRRAVARQRARFGAQGVGNNGGSSEAVLLGLFEESEQEKLKREQLDALRNQSARLGVENQHSMNLLEITSLAERQNLQRFYMD